MTNLERSLLDSLTAPATPSDFAELEARGILRPVVSEKRWFVLLKPELLRVAAKALVTAVERTRLGGLRLRFRQETSKVLKRVELAHHGQPADAR